MIIQLGTLQQTFPYERTAELEPPHRHGPTSVADAQATAEKR